MKILEVFTCEENTSDSGVVFYKVGFRAVTVDEKGNSLFAGREKGTATFFAGEQPNVGDRFQGDIYHFETTPYEIGDGREVNKVKIVAFADETPLEIANKLLERNNACVIMNGNPTKKLKKKVVAKVEETEPGED